MKCKINKEHLTINDIDCSIRNILTAEELCKQKTTLDDFVAAAQQCFCDFANGKNVREIANQLATIEGQMQETTQHLLELAATLQPFNIQIDLHAAEECAAKIHRALA